jgi:anti-sigma regulatory factor (Ser/Thr protein kinase)
VADGDVKMSQSDWERSRAAEPVSGPEACAAGMLRLPARPSYLGLVGLFVQWFGNRAGLSREKCHELEVAVDEVCTNVIRHASGPGTAGKMTVVCSPFEEGLRVTVADHGRPFDPAEAARIADHKRSRDPASGGMGLLLVRHLTDAMEYQWSQGEGNRLTLTKHK